MLFVYFVYRGFV